MQGGELGFLRDLQQRLLECLPHDDVQQGGYLLVEIPEDGRVCLRVGVYPALQMDALHARRITGRIRRAWRRHQNVVCLRGLVYD